MLSLLNQALAMGQEISEQMLQENWEVIDVLQQQQQQIFKLLETCELPENEVEITELRRLSLQLQTLTDQQLKISHNRKDKIFQEIKKGNKSNKMHNAYKQNS